MGAAERRVRDARGVAAVGALERADEVSVPPGGVADGLEDEPRHGLDLRVVAASTERLLVDDVGDTGRRLLDGSAHQSPSGDLERGSHVVVGGLLDGEEGDEP